MSKNLGSYVTSFSLYKFLQDISKPITNLAAFKLGIIDARGNQKKEPATPSEKDAYSPYYQMIIMVKKVFNRVPDPRTSAQLKTLMGTIQLFGEEVKLLGGNPEEVKNGIVNVLMERGIDIESEMLSENFNEEIANIASSGHVAGMGYGSKPPDNVKIQPRKKNVCDVTDPNKNFKCKFGKAPKMKKRKRTDLRSHGPSVFYMRRKDK